MSGFQPLDVTKAILGMSLEDFITNILDISNKEDFIDNRSCSLKSTMQDLLLKGDEVAWQALINFKHKAKLKATLKPTEIGTQLSLTGPYQESQYAISHVFGDLFSALFMHNPESRNQLFTNLVNEQSKRLNQKKGAFFREADGCSSSTFTFMLGISLIEASKTRNLIPSQGEKFVEIPELAPLLKAVYEHFKRRNPTDQEAFNKEFQGFMNYFCEPFFQRGFGLLPNICTPIQVDGKTINLEINFTPKYEELKRLGSTFPAPTATQALGIGSQAHLDQGAAHILLIALSQLSEKYLDVQKALTKIAPKAQACQTSEQLYELLTQQILQETSELRQALTQKKLGLFAGAKAKALEPQKTNDLAMLLNKVANVEILRNDTPGTALRRVKGVATQASPSSPAASSTPMTAALTATAPASVVMTISGLSAGSNTTRTATSAERDRQIREMQALTQSINTATTQATVLEVLKNPAISQYLSADYGVASEAMGERASFQAALFRVVNSKISLLPSPLGPVETAPLVPLITAMDAFRKSVEIGASLRRNIGDMKALKEKIEQAPEPKKQIELLMKHTDDLLRYLQMNLPMRRGAELSEGCKAQLALAKAIAGPPGSAIYAPLSQAVMAVMQKLEPSATHTHLGGSPLGSRAHMMPPSHLRAGPGSYPEQ